MTETPLTVKKTVFETSMKKRADYPGGQLPEIAFAGKSNSGKSSLINYLANHSKLAYVSKQPGKTRLINYFRVNEAFYLVDLPGYGYAKVSRQEQRAWGEMMQGYFEVADRLAGLMILMDIRHPASEDDLQMIEWALHFGIPFVVVATKADKIAKSKRKYAADKIAGDLAERLDLPDIKIIVVSSQEKKGKEELLACMQEMLTEVER